MFLMTSLIPTLILPLGTRLLMLLLGCPIPLQRITLIITSTRIAAGVSRFVIYTAEVRLEPIHIFVIDGVLRPGDTPIRLCFFRGLLLFYLGLEAKPQGEV